MAQEVRDGCLRSLLRERGVRACKGVGQCGGEGHAALERASHAPPHKHELKPAQVLGVLGGPGDARGVENELVLSLGFEAFELIKELLRNRLKIVWCTRLSRAQVRRPAGCLAASVDRGFHSSSSLLQQQLPQGLGASLWACVLAWGMLVVCVRRTSSIAPTKPYHVLN